MSLAGAWWAMTGTFCPGSCTSRFPPAARLPLLIREGVTVSDVMLPDVLSVLLRALTYILLLQAAGVALFLARFGRLLSDSREAIRQTGLVSAIAGIVAVIGYFALEAPRMAGEMSGLWDLSLQGVALHSAIGEVFGLRVLGLSVLALALCRGGGDVRATSIVGATLAVAAFLLSGHTAVHPQRWILGPLLATHLLVIAFWFGSLPALYLASRREPVAAAAKIVEAFSAIAVWVVPVILLAGLAMAALLVPSWAVLHRPYGELLLVKTGGFAALMALAAMNKWRLGPGGTSGNQRALLALRASIATEFVLIIGVFTATAVMTMFFSPE
jgi:putative copper export protein